MPVTGPETLGKYEILDLLGKGGMGTVYRARDPLLERIVALKVLHPDSAADPESVENWRRFLNEARAIARLNHPSIVAIYQFSDATPTAPYFAMEYVEGASVTEYVRQQERTRVAVTLDLVCQLLAGLDYAHRQGVVHRDIKPSNLLVTRDGRLKITDFGIARVGSLKHTQTGFMMGTPGYMSPERYHGGAIDQRCDVYSAGVLCYELLTGRVLFTGSLAEIVYQICQATPVAVSAAEPAIPALLDPVVARALAKEPDRRYQTAMEFYLALRAAQAALGHGAGSGHRDSSSAPEQLAELDSDVLPTPSAAAGTDPALEANTVLSPGWSMAEISQIVRQLTPILGPMARVVVKRHAALTRDRGELYAALARQLHSDEERESFLAAMARASGKNRVVAPDVPLTGSATIPQVTLGAIAPATLERTTKIFARYIGPIAAVVVKKTAATALGDSDLHARLAERIADADERARFVAELAQPPDF